MADGPRPALETEGGPLSAFTRPSVTSARSPSTDTLSLVLTCLSVMREEFWISTEWVELA
jgi:hypothetical protein